MEDGGSKIEERERQTDRETERQRETETERGWWKRRTVRGRLINRLI